MRLAITIFLLLLLVSAATWEQLFIRNVYSKLETDIDAFYAVVLEQIERKENIDTESNIEKIESICEYWLGREKRLALFARHNDLAQVSDSLVYAMNFTRFNIPEETCAGIERAKYLIDTHFYNIGTSVQNII